MRAVELTELVAGQWQLRPWPAAYADLDEVLAELCAPEDVVLARAARLEGWQRGDVLGFAVREITTGASVAEVLVTVLPDGRADVALHRRPGAAGAVVEEAVADVVRRWVAGALGLTLVPAPS